MPKYKEISKPGYYDIPMEHYINDPVREPSMSKGVVKDLIYRTPNRARYFHPQLGGGTKANASVADFGTAVHNGITGGRELVYAPAEFKDWRKDIAKAFKAEAYEKWQVPLLESDRQPVDDIVGIIRDFIKAELGKCSYEQTMVWQHENGVYQRARYDIANSVYDIDIKTASNANPIEWGAFSAINGGYDIQAAMRDDGHQKLGEPRKLAWLVIECEPPYDFGLYDVAESMISIGRRKVNKAADIWARCLKSKAWPSYGKDIINASSRAEFDVAGRA